MLIFQTINSKVIYHQHSICWYLIRKERKNTERETRIWSIFQCTDVGFPVTTVVTNKCTGVWHVYSASVSFLLIRSVDLLPSSLLYMNPWTPNWIMHYCTLALHPPPLLFLIILPITPLPLQTTPLSSLTSTTLHYEDILKYFSHRQISFFEIYPGFWPRPQPPSFILFPLARAWRRVISEFSNLPKFLNCLLTYFEDESSTSS